MLGSGAETHWINIIRTKDEGAEIHNYATA